MKKIELLVKPTVWAKVISNPFEWPALTFLAIFYNAPILYVKPKGCPVETLRINDM